MYTHILVVDDDKQIRELLSKFLRKHGYIISSAHNIKTAEELLSVFKFDIVIMDVMLPEERGIDFIKRAHLPCPVIMLTALGDIDDRIDGLASGADDYLTKPFDPTELLLRLRNIIRRTIPKSNKVSFGGFEFDLNHSILTYKSERIHLTNTENQLLQLLCSRANNIYSREEMKNKLNEVNPRTIDAQVARLRNKIEVDPKFPKYLQTIRGKGYILRTD